MDKKPAKGEYLEVLLRSAKTIFSTKDAALLWKEDREHVISNRLNKYAESGKLIRVHRGLYAKDEHYDRFELATRIYTPSYISFETVLAREGITFQYYDTIFAASYVSRHIQVGGQRIAFVRVNQYMLSNTLGIDHEAGYAVAQKERAFLDRIYASKDYHFDNLDPLDWDEVFKMLSLYKSKRVAKKVHQYFDHFKTTAA